MSIVPSRRNCLRAPATMASYVITRRLGDTCTFSLSDAPCAAALGEHLRGGQSTRKPALRLAIAPVIAPARSEAAKAA